MQITHVDWSPEPWRDCHSIDVGEANCSGTLGQRISIGSQLRERGFEEPAMLGIPRHKFGTAARSGIVGRSLDYSSLPRRTAALEVLAHFHRLITRSIVIWSLLCELKETRDTRGAAVGCEAGCAWLGADGVVAPSLSAVWAIRKGLHAANSATRQIFRIGDVLCRFSAFTSPV